MDSESPTSPRGPGARNRWRIFEPRCIRSDVLIRLILASALVFAATACKHNKRATTTVTRRAAFDLDCPKEELKLNVVDIEGARKMATQIAVRGCDQKAVYVYYPDSDTWIIDGAVTALSADYQVPPPIDKGRGKRGDKQTIKAEKRGKMTNDPPVEKEKRKKRKDKEAPALDEVPSVEPAPE